MFGKLVISENQQVERVEQSIFNIIQLLNRNITGKKAVLEIMLFNDLLNSFSSISEVGFVGILYFSTNMISMKQYIDSEIGF